VIAAEGIGVGNGGSGMGGGGTSAEKDNTIFSEEELEVTQLQEMLQEAQKKLWRLEEESDMLEKTLKMKRARLQRQKKEIKQKRTVLRKREAELKKLEALYEGREDEYERQTIERLMLSIEYGELDVLGCLGGGGFSQVYKARWKGDLVAVKKLNVNDSDSPAACAAIVKSFQKETLLLSQLRHSNIVLLMAISTDYPQLALITELMTKGDLYDLLHGKDSVPWLLRIRIAEDVARAMNYLHSMQPPIVHRDLKSRNILLDERYNAKLADFGATRVRENTIIETSTSLGTPAYMAPECLRGESFDEKSDIYSYGVVLYELLTGRTPWEGKHPTQIIGGVGFGGDRLQLPSSVPAGCPPDFLDLIKRCWLDANLRPPFSQILQQVRTWRTQLMAQLFEAT